MSKPVILAVDDDASVLEAVVQDLRRKYGENYRILRASSGQAALEATEELGRRGDSVALFLSDQRMPGMTGIELLEKTMALFPDAKRALLTAYADTEAAIRAINAARIHYYLTKPWDPPEEKLYPIVDDLLDSWCSTYRAPFEGLRVIGARYGLRDHQVRDFLTKNYVPYVWMDPEVSAEGRELLARHKLEDAKMPVLLFPDGSYLVQPGQAELAERIGLRTQSQSDFYDLVILGAGLAGLAAAVYGASEGLRTLVIEQEAPGGQAGSSSSIENYLGFPNGLQGAELARRAYQQASRFGAEFLMQRAVGIHTENGYHFVRLGDQASVSAQACLIATGVNWRRLPVPGLERLVGSGVYYGAALAEAKSCSGEEVFLIGGANSAGQAAMYFSRYARRVVMIVRAPSLEKSMSKYLIDEIARESNIEIWTQTVLVEVMGDTHLQCIRVRGPQGERTVPATGLFIFIGAQPDTEWLSEAVLRDEHGFVLSGPQLKGKSEFSRNWNKPREPYLLETSVPGLFAAGDVRYGSVKRAASAVGEGSIAVQFIHQYMAEF
jgi:thioredoxin reductase (NADPH)